MQPKGLNRLAKVDFGHQCLREENPSFNIGYVIPETRRAH
jgi:hypothetical protein